MAKQQKGGTQKKKGQGQQLAVGIRAEKGRTKLKTKEGQSRKDVRKSIHPRYVECEVKCACGNSFMTHSTQPKIEVEVCSACHPFYSGQSRLVDTAGRVEKFQRKYAWKDGKAQKKAQPRKKRVADLKD